MKSDKSTSTTSLTSNCGTQRYLVFAQFECQFDRRQSQVCVMTLITLLWFPRETLSSSIMGQMFPSSPYQLGLGGAYNTCMKKCKMRRLSLIRRSLQSPKSTTTFAHLDFFFSFDRLVFLLRGVDEAMTAHCFDPLRFNDTNGLNFTLTRPRLFLGGHPFLFGVGCLFFCSSFGDVFRHGCCCWNG